MSLIQSVLFDKGIYKPPEARQWLKRHNLKPIKRLHETEGYYRYRIAEPIRSQKYRIINLSDHIKAVVMIQIAAPNL